MVGESNVEVMAGGQAEVVPGFNVVCTVHIIGAGFQDTSGAYGNSGGTAGREYPCNIGFQTFVDPVVYVDVEIVSAVVFIREPLAQAYAAVRETSFALCQSV